MVGVDNLGICLDTGHLNLVDGDQAAFIDKCGSHLKALHLADNLGQNDNHMLPYSAGTVDWERVIGALKKNNYSGLFNFEVGNLAISASQVVWYPPEKGLVIRSVVFRPSLGHKSETSISKREIRGEEWKL